MRSQWRIRYDFPRIMLQRKVRWLWVFSRWVDICGVVSIQEARRIVSDIEHAKL
jgi:hypothetical protein